MWLRLTLATALSVAGGLWTPGATAHAPFRQAGGGALVLTNARLIDGTGRVRAERGVLVVRDGRIVAAGPTATVVVPSEAAAMDLEGRTVMPGLINAHGHVGDTRGLEASPAHYTPENLLRQLRLYAAYGVTTVVSLGGDGPAGFALRDASWTDALDRSRLLVAGPVVTATTVEEARREVARVAGMKPDFIKIRVDDNLGTTRKMPLDVATAVIDEAHGRGLRVAVHIFYLEDAKALVRAGADLVAHSVRDQPVDEEFVELLTARRVCVSPTLTRELSTFVYESEPAFFSDPAFLRTADPDVLAQLRDPDRQARMRESTSARRYKQALEVATANVWRLFDAGAGLAFGTDSGPPARFQGYFEHLELEMLSKVLPPAAVLGLATGGTARCLHLPDLGGLGRGQRADFMVVEGNPLTDIRETRRIHSVWIGGRRFGS